MSVCIYIYKYEPDIHVILVVSFYIFDFDICNVEDYIVVLFSLLLGVI